jgi:hypothetical protein
MRITVLVEQPYRGSLDEIDFKQIQGAMSLLNWRWDFAWGTHVPTVEELRRRVDRLFRRLDRTMPNDSVKSGGMRVSLKRGRIRIAIDLKHPTTASPPRVVHTRRVAQLA